MDDRQAALVAASTDLLADPTCYDLLERATRAASAVQDTLPALREALDKLTDQQTAICVAMTVAAKVAEQQDATATVSIKSAGVEYTCVMPLEQAKRITGAMDESRERRAAQGAVSSLADFIRSRGGSDE